MTPLEDTSQYLLVTFYEEPRETQGGWIIGDDSGTALVQSVDGRLLSVHQKGELPSCHVNSSQAAFRECLTLYGQFLQAVWRKETPVDMTSVASLKQAIETADHTAFCDERSWWSMIFEQVEYELS